MQVLIIGGGDGGVAREVVKHPAVEMVDLSEIDEVIFISILNNSQSDIAKRHLLVYSGSSNFSNAAGPFLTHPVFLNVFQLFIHETSLFAISWNSTSFTRRTFSIPRKSTVFSRAQKIMSTISRKSTENKMTKNMDFLRK